MHGISRIGHERVQIARQIEPFEHPCSDALEPRVFGIAVFEDVQIVGAVVDAWTQQHHVGLGVRPQDELAHGAGAQIGLEFEFRRQESVEGVLIERLVKQVFANGPILEPIGAFVLGVVQDFEARIQFLARGIVIEDLVNMHRMHDSKDTGFRGAAHSIRGGAAGEPRQQVQISCLVGAHRVAGLDVRAPVGAEAGAQLGRFDQCFQMALPLVDRRAHESR